MTNQLNRVIAGALLLTSLNIGRAQGTAFTYQGRLNDGASPASGTYDLRFTVYDSAGGPAVVAGPITSSATGVSNGLFTATLDFGASVFTGPARWLEIAARTNGGATFTALSPRQALTPAPYALFAPNAGAAASALTAGFATTASGVTPGAVSQLGSPGGALTNALQVNANGWVGIGTNAPQAGLQLATGSQIYQPNLRFQVRDGTDSYTNLNSAWGVAVSTNHLLAVAANSGGLTLMGIANPQSPVLYSQFRDGEGVFTNLAGANGPAFNGTVLAVAAMSDSAVTILSVTNPASPVKLAELRDGVGPFTLLGGAYEAAFAGNLMAVSAFSDNAVTLVNMNNPAAPALSGYIQNGFNGFTNLLNPRQMVFDGSILIVAANNSSAVNLIDVSNPANPQLRATIKDGVNGFTNMAMSNGGIALSTNHLLAICAQGSSAVNLVDISNPASPQLRAVIKDGVGGFNYLNGVNRTAFLGNLLAIGAIYENAVTLVDVSNPAAPVLKGTFPNGQAGLNALAGPAGVIFDGSTLAVAANSASGVTLLQPSLVTLNLVANDYVGIGTATPEAPLHVVGNMIVQNASLVELRANQIAMGSSTTASGSSATAMGSGTAASGQTSTAMGNSTTASGYTSTAMGNSTKATGAYSTAMGLNTTASGSYSTAMGRNTIASADDATALGLGCTASGWDSVAMGTYSVAGGHYSLAAGYYSQATNQSAFVWSDSSPGTPFGSTAANQFLIRATGGVGINTNRPQSALHVNGAITAAGLNIVGTNNMIQDGTGGGILRIGPKQATGIPKLIKFGDGDVVSIGENSYDDHMELRAQWISLLNYGGIAPYVGIGKTNPAATLDVNGSVAISGQNTLEFGAGIAGKEPAAGKIGYGTFSGGGSLDIVGAGTNNTTRKVQIYAEGGAQFVGPVNIQGRYLTVSGGGNEQAYMGGDGSGGDVEIGSRNAGVMNVGFWNAGAFSHMNLFALTFNPGSDRNIKQDFKPVDAQEILSKVVALPITEWAYKADAQTHHLGPVAQDFQAAFGLGSSDKSIATVDADGVALAAIQGLNQKVEAKTQQSETSIRKLEAENAELKARLEKMERLLNSMNGGAQ